MGGGDGGNGARNPYQTRYRLRSFAHSVVVQCTEYCANGVCHQTSTTTIGRVAIAFLQIHCNHNGLKEKMQTRRIRGSENQGQPAGLALLVFLTPYLGFGTPRPRAVSG